MAEDKSAKKEFKKLEDKKDKSKEKKVEKAKPEREEVYESLVRIFGYDIPGSKAIYPGLTRIKGVSWAISNALCLKSGMSRDKKISELSKDEIKQIENMLSTLSIPDYMKNRRKDPVTGKTEHLYGTDLDIAKDFDIKRMKKMKSYVGVRHMLGQPVRGQRTRAHFRKNKLVAVGAKKGKPLSAAPAAGAKK